jgi:hypothetical protein
LDHADGPKAGGLQVGGERAQHGIGILIRLIDQGREIALGIEHGETRFCAMSES